MRNTQQICSPLLSVEEAAEYLGMSVPWCYRNLKRHMPYEKIGGALKFHIDDLNEFIERSKHPPLGVNVRDVKSSVSLRELIRGNRLRKNE
jgi:excisionase family DNA binding protein